MKISMRWLQHFLNKELSIDEVVETLTMAGLEVEEEIDLGMKSGLIVVAKVLEVKPHPSADKLSLCQVDAGQGEPLSIVCGAPNVTADELYPCALVGATLPGGFTIKRAKIRGVDSQGMLCAADELGLGTDHSGIMPLPPDWTVGEPFDYQIDIKVTPNRPDCLSMLGVAREIGAMVDKKVFPPTPRVKEMLDQIDATVKVTVPARVECPRYTCRLIRGVRIQESPVWLKRALEVSGMRPVNNVVDVTNYVLHELGHPLHAFDYDTLTGGEIVVRLAKPGESLTIIDGSQVKLCPEDLVIADAERPVALAGIMGGKATEVTPETVNILLESAYFEPTTIRKTARRNNLSTEASYRFERGTDRERLTLALNRATQLIHELAGGEVAKGILDVHAPPTELGPIVLQCERLNRMLGLELTSTEIADYLVRLGFEIRSSDRSTLVVTPPTYRVDVSRDVDLIEDVARLFNYNRIPSRLPHTVTRQSVAPVLDGLVAKGRRAMMAEGFNEAMTYSFIGEDQVRAIGLDPEQFPHVANPLSVDQVVMRPALLPGLLKVAGYNQKQDESSIALFEIGKVWTPGAAAGRVDDERWELTAVLTGPVPAHWGAVGRQYDFYDLKGVIENFLSQWADTPVNLQALGGTVVYHPGRSATIFWGDRLIGDLGEIHPDLNDAFDLRGNVYAARLDLSAVAQWAQSHAKAFHEISRHPGSQRDLALVLDLSVPAGMVIDAAKEAGKGLLESVVLFDVYEGEHIPKGKKSLALRLRLRSSEKTLTEDDINTVVERVLRHLTKKFDATLRA